MDPWQICFVEEFVQIFNNSVSFCNLGFITPKPPLILGFVTSFHAANGGFLLLIYPPLHRQCLLYLSIWFRILIGTMIAHI
jgi:hypothetical protein